MPSYQDRPAYKNALADVLRTDKSKGTARNALLGHLADALYSARSAAPPYAEPLASAVNVVPTPPMRNTGLASGIGIESLGLTPQERNLYNHHVDNMNYKRTVGNSSILQMVVDGPDGQVYNIPTVWDGKILKPEEAYKRAAQVGWEHWPSYGPVHSRDEEAKLKAMGKPSNYEIADERYMQMHKFLDRDPPAMVR